MRYAGLAVILLVLGGCATQPIETEGFEPAPPEMVVVDDSPDGGIYDPLSNRFFFEDIRARRVGDVIHVILDEATDATKSASTSTAKGSSVEIAPPVLFGGGVTLSGQELLAAQLAGNRDFQGSADSSQSNRLSGSIAVTVERVLPNGNLWIRGQKVITLNQGTEIVQLTGMVRAADVSPNNAVLSTQIADANITYGGRGLLADSNTPGWLTRFFHSPVWPF